MLQVNMLTHLLMLVEINDQELYLLEIHTEQVLTSEQKL